MFNILKFNKNYIPLGVCLLGVTAYKMEKVHQVAHRAIDFVSFPGIFPSNKGSINALYFSKALCMGNLQGTPANGIIEKLIRKDHQYEGTRIFPDGRKERGLFDGVTRNLLSGYRITIDGSIEFIHPKSLAFYEAEQERVFEVCEVEEKLVVLERTYGDDCQRITKDMPVETVLLQSSRRTLYCSEGRGIKDILLHKSMIKNKKSFLESALAADASGTPRIFGFSNLAAVDVIEIASTILDINPLKLVDPVSGRNFFIQAAHFGNKKLVTTLIELFLQEFLSVGQSVIAELLTQGHSRYLVQDVAEQFRKLGGVLDTYHSLWVQVAQSTEPDKTFKTQFLTMSTKQQQGLYDAAFTYNNPFIYEPADVPITAEQYSINLMWINKNTIPEDQEFLFGNGSSREEQKRDFHRRFIEPVSKWAKKNPGSIINIWIDSEMATAQIVQRSRMALETALQGSSHGIIQFRDVRSIDVVRSHHQVFSERIPVYFRVDLLRAIAADYTLSRKETTFFVYGDIDMEPLSAQEIFDKRTVNFLQDVGFIMAKGGWLGFENGFQVLNGNHAQFMDSHRKVIIDLSIEMALEKPRKISEQQIYDTYPAMITHFLAADGRYGKLHFYDTREPLQSEDPVVILGQFRYDRFSTSAHMYLPLKGAGVIQLKDIMPRKPVRLPPSHF